MRDWFIKCYLFFLELWFEIKSFFYSVKRLIYNRGIKLRWHRLWVRKDEFHKSLDMDFEAMIGMSKTEQYDYIRDLIRRRQIAHERDLSNN